MLAVPFPAAGGESPALARKPQILKPAPNRAAEEEEDMGGPGVWAGRERGRYDIRAIGGSDQETLMNLLIVRGGEFSRGQCRVCGID